MASSELVGQFYVQLRKTDKHTSSINGSLFSGTRILITYLVATMELSFENSLILRTLCINCDDPKYKCTQQIFNRVSPYATVIIFCWFFGTVNKYINITPKRYCKTRVGHFSQKPFVKICHVYLLTNTWCAQGKSYNYLSQAGIKFATVYLSFRPFVCLLAGLR